MSNVVKYYYPSPTIEHHPKNGRIQIGNLLWDPVKPEDCNSRGAPPPPPLHDTKTNDVRDIIEYGPELVKPTALVSSTPASATATVAAAPADQTNADIQAAPSAESEAFEERTLHPTTISCQRTADLTTATLRASSFGVWSKLYSVVSSSVVLEWTDKHDAVWGFDKLVTIVFYPDDDYINKCVAMESVKRILIRTKYKKPVYLITGIKAAVDKIKAKTDDEATRNISGSVEGNAKGATQGAVDGKVGAKTEHKKEAKLGQSFEDHSDFVLAFRLKKIMVDSKTGKASSINDVTKRALLGKDGASSDLPFEVDEVKDGLPEDMDLVGVQDDN